ncbi:MAG: YitT family protein [Bacteroidales bacterium]|nr:YitT family protein [Bacteroidales bacterium]
MKINIWSEIRSYSIMTLGLFIFAFGWITFIIPQEIAGGGVIGLASITFYATGIPVSYTYFTINIVLLIIGFMIMGNKFGIKTIFGIGVSTILFQFLPEIITWRTELSDDLFNAIIGGTLSGVGIGMVFMQGGSTGGTDIIALIMSKFHNTSPGRVFIYCDLVIIGSIYFLPGKNLESVIYGYLEMVSFSYVIDLIISGNKQSVQIMVFSKQYAAIADRITQDLERGVTALDSVGWWSKEESKVLIILVRKNEINMFYRIIREIDAKAFISVANVMGVFGEGFEQIKTGKPFWKKPKA